MTDEETAGECGACTALRDQVDRAARAYDRSAEVDARVKLRRHVKRTHGRDLPLTFFSEAETERP